MTRKKLIESMRNSYCYDVLPLFEKALEISIKSETAAIEETGVRPRKLGTNDFFKLVVINMHSLLDVRDIQL